MDIRTQYSELQFQALGEILEEFRKQYICKETMLPLLLTGSPEMFSDLQKIDSLYQSIQTSLRFQQYRRATWYIIAFVTVCRRTLQSNAIESLQAQLASKLSIEQL